MTPPRERQPSVDDLDPRRPPKREGSADSFPVFTDKQAEQVFDILRGLDSDISELNKNVLKVLDRDAAKGDRDAEQEKRLGELETFRAQMMKDTREEAGKTATRWSAIGTVLGVVIASAVSAGMTQCRWLPAPPAVQQLTPTPR